MGRHLLCPECPECPRANWDISDILDIPDIQDILDIVRIYGKMNFAKQSDAKNAKQSFKIRQILNFRREAFSFNSLSYFEFRKLKFS